MNITTNHHDRFFVYGYDVPANVLANQFDYLEDGEEDDGFIYYRGTWYHRCDFMRFGYPGPFGQTRAGWHGYHPDGFTSGVVIKLSDDGETYRIGTYC